MTELLEFAARALLVSAGSVLGWYVVLPLIQKLLKGK